jgi:hypothetical protein
MQTKSKVWYIWPKKKPTKNRININSSKGSEDTTSSETNLHNQIQE